MLNSCWGQYLQLHIARHSKMQINFVFYAYMLYILMMGAPGNSRRSNKQYNELIYTPKYVLHLPEHPPITEAKIQGNSRRSNKRCNELIYPPKHVLHLPEHPPITEAKIQKCFSIL